MWIFILTWVVSGIVGVIIPLHYLDNKDITVGNILIGAACGYLILFVSIVWILIHFITSDRIKNILKIVIISKLKKGKT